MCGSSVHFLIHLMEQRRNGERWKTGGFGPMATPEVKRERLEQLFSRADLPREWLDKHFQDAYIEKIQVSLSRRTWTLFLGLKRPVPPHIWQEMESRLSSVLGRAAGVSVRLRPEIGRASCREQGLNASEK